MKRADLVKEIESKGCILIRHGGKHDWYRIRLPRFLNLFHGTAKSLTAWQSISSKC